MIMNISYCRNFLLSPIVALLIIGCDSRQTEELSSSAAETAPTVEVNAVAEPPQVEAENSSLVEILAAQEGEVRARYPARHPEQTLEFFGIVPGMTVIEVFPGGGWYSQILTSYLGEEATLIGAHYPASLYRKFGMSPESVVNALNRDKDWPQTMAESAAVSPVANMASAILTEIPEEYTGQADAIFIVRALHNLHRYEPEGQYFSDSVAEMYRVLKPGGVVGVVQHRAPESNSDEWADGSAGYLKQSRIIAALEAVGFVLEEASEINANPNDQPTEEDVVWRLAPGFGGTEPDTPEREAIAAIGESDRMTLRFRKPVTP